MKKDEIAFAIEIAESIIKKQKLELTPDNIILTVIGEFDFIIDEKDINEYRAGKLINHENYDIESRKIEYYGNV